MTPPMSTDLSPDRTADLSAELSVADPTPDLSRRLSSEMAGPLSGQLSSEVSSDLSRQNGAPPAAQPEQDRTPVPAPVLPAVPEPVPDHGPDRHPDHGTPPATKRRGGGRREKHTTPDSVVRLRAEAEEAGLIRGLHLNPDVVALRVEKLRKRVDRLLWAAIALGMAFTMVNVQQFAAAGAEPGSLVWISAWFLDPMITLGLLAVLFAEQTTARYRIQSRGVVRIAKWAALGVTYAMNTWQSWTAVVVSPANLGAWASALLHSVPPIMVLVFAEVGPVLRDMLTEAVVRAHAEAAEVAARADEAAKNAAARVRQSAAPQAPSLPEEANRAAPTSAQRATPAASTSSSPASGPTDLRLPQQTPASTPSPDDPAWIAWGAELDELNGGIGRPTLQKAISTVRDDGRAPGTKNAMALLNAIRAERVARTAA